MRTITRQKQSGFTLVELLIVVIILAILAAIVVPQFSSTTDDAKTSSMQSNLAAMRSAMELYYIQHGEYPGKAAASAATSDCTVAAAAGAVAGATHATSFASQLTHFTNSAGQICGIKSATFKYGPYIKGGDLPENEAGAASTNAVVVVADASDGQLSLTAPGTAGGWYVDTESGLIVVNHTDDDHL